MTGNILLYVTAYLALLIIALAFNYSATRTASCESDES